MKLDFLEFMMDLVLDWENIPVYLPEEVDQEVDVIDVVDDIILRIDTATDSHDESSSFNLYKEGWDTVLDLYHFNPEIIFPGFRPIII